MPLNGRFAHRCAFPSLLLALSLALPSDAADCINYEEHPHWIGQVALPGPASVDMEVYGDHAILCNREEGIRIVDLSDPLEPELLGHLETLDAQNAAVSGNRAYIADSDGGLRIVSVANPSMP